MVWSFLGEIVGFIKMFSKIKQELLSITYNIINKISENAKMEWSELEKEVRQLSEKIVPYNHEIIVAVVRGGMVPARARLLSSYLVLKMHIA